MFPMVVMFFDFAKDSGKTTKTTVNGRLWTDAMAANLA
jgi:hypothetical protein